MLAGNRSHRVGDQILKEISELLLRKVKDPRLKGVTLTDVSVSRDLRRAYVYYSILGEGEQKKQAQEGFESARGYIRREIGERLQLRYVPDVQFRYDNSLEYGQKMERILEELSSAKDE
jgi:ribosome-binding factor A